MKNETEIWLQYSDENLNSARILLESHLYNPCLHNAQQSVEKALKAVLIETSIKLVRTHDILELKLLLSKNGIDIDITDDECDLLNSIYIPSKYPVGGALPDYDPEYIVCNEVISIAEKVYSNVLDQFS